MIDARMDHDHDVGTGNMIPCPTCAAHYKAVDEAVRAAVDEYDGKLEAIQRKRDRADRVMGEVGSGQGGGS